MNDHLESKLCDCCFEQGPLFAATAAVLLLFSSDNFRCKSLTDTFFIYFFNKHLQRCSPRKKMIWSDQRLVFIHKLNFSWLNLAARDPNGRAKRPAKV
jgi:hypothetical protein